MESKGQKNEQRFAGGKHPFWEKWWFWVIVVVAVAVTILSNVQVEESTDSEPVANMSKEQPTEQPTEQSAEQPTEAAKDTERQINKETDVPEPTQGKDKKAIIQYNDLQKMYLDIDPKSSYSEMVDFIKGKKMPYSEEKSNGSRTIQVAFTKDCTMQSHKKENGDYLKIIYVYPESENSKNDDLEKYSIGTIAYCPNDSDLELISHYSGTYFSYHDKGNYISDFGTTINLSKEMSRKDQMKYYFENK